MLQRIFKHFIYRLKNAYYWLLFRLLCVFPINNKKIVFIGGERFDGGPKLIFSEMIKLENTEIDLVCALSSVGDDVQGARVIKSKGIRFVYELMTSKVWISDSRQQAYFRKRKKQYYIMTWHGAAPLKYIEKDAEDTLPKGYIKCAKNDSKNADLIVAESEFNYRIIKNSFWYDGEILKEEFINKNLHEDSRSKVREFFNISQDYKIILYVPTFRKDYSTKCYDIEYERMLDLLDNHFNRKHLFIVRLHENIASKSGFIVYNEHILNGTYYDSIDELILASDYIISDYSSCLFDGYKAYKKVFIYASDYVEYKAQDRGMYFDLSELPSPFAGNTDELISNIVLYDEEKYKLLEKELNDEIGYYGGDAAKTIATRILVSVV